MRTQGDQKKVAHFFNYQKKRTEAQNPIFLKKIL